MRISYWSSYVCSSDLDVNKYIRAAMMAVAATAAAPAAAQVPAQLPDYYPPSYEKIVEGSKSEGHLLIYSNLSADMLGPAVAGFGEQIGRASCRERVCQYV